MDDLVRPLCSRTAKDRGLRLTWRRLDGLALAATLGVIVVSPQTALLMGRVLGPRIPAFGPGASQPERGYGLPGRAPEIADAPCEVVVAAPDRR